MRSSSRQAALFVRRTKRCLFSPNVGENEDEFSPKFRRICLTHFKCVVTNQCGYDPSPPARWQLAAERQRSSSRKRHILRGASSSPAREDSLPFQLPTPCAGVLSTPSPSSQLGLTRFLNPENSQPPSHPQTACPLGRQHFLLCSLDLVRPAICLSDPFSPRRFPRLHTQTFSDAHASLYRRSSLSDSERLQRLRRRSLLHPTALADGQGKRTLDNCLLPRAHRRHPARIADLSPKLVLCRPPELQPVAKPSGLPRDRQ